MDLSQVGFVGLGNLGRAMVQRFLSQGVKVFVWNRTPEKAEGLDVDVAKVPLDLFDEVEVVFVCLFDSEAVAEVAESDDGLLAGDCAGKIVVDCTTHDYAAVQAFHLLFAQHDAGYLEAPVLGSVVPATQGALTMLTSGGREVYEEVEPALKHLAKTIYHFERPGLATKMKLVNNLVLGSFMATLAEAVSLGEAIGLPKEQVLDILANGAGNSAVLNAKRAKIQNEDFSPHFSVAAIHKDLTLCYQLIQEIGKESWTGTGAALLYNEAYHLGFGEKDLSVLYELVRQGHIYRREPLS